MEFTPRSSQEPRTHHPSRQDHSRIATTTGSSNNELVLSSDPRKRSERMYDQYVEGKTDGYQQGWFEGWEAAVAQAAVAVVDGKMADGTEVRYVYVGKIDGGRE
jgi:hypothetical protein